MSGGRQLAMHKRHMMSILMRNGHLIVQGDESTEELRTALRYLRRHTQDRCKRPGLGIPIEALLPDISVIELASTGSRNVRDVVDKRERL